MGSPPLPAMTPPTMMVSPMGSFNTATPSPLRRQYLRESAERSARTSAPSSRRGMLMMLRHFVSLALAASLAGVGGLQTTLAHSTRLRPVGLPELTGAD